MTDEQRKRLHELLLDAGGIEGLEELEEVAAHEVEVIEPEIDEWVRDAFEAGVELGLRGRNGEEAEECSAEKRTQSFGCGSTTS